MLSKDMLKLMLESATEKANASQALRSIGEKCQKIAGDLSNIKLRDLPVVIKTLKLNSENDLTDIKNVQTTVNDYLDQMIQTCMEASGKIDDLSYEIMGDLKLSDEQINKVTDELDLDDEEPEIDLDSEEEPDFDLETGREMK